MSKRTAAPARSPARVTIGTYRLPADPGSPAEARRFVSRLAEEHHFDAEGAGLVTSELATNAVEHANSPFVVEVSVAGPVLRIEVSDDSRTVPAVAVEDQWGLRLVEAIACAWGCYPTVTGKTVWAEMGSADEPDE